MKYVLNVSKIVNIVKILKSNITYKIKCIFAKIYSGSQNKRKLANKAIKMLNGKIKQNSIKILNWNKGSSNIIKKIDDIKDFIKAYKPKVFVIN